MPKSSYKVAFLHYSAPPVIGGVESVILAHTRLFVAAGYPTTVLAGRGTKEALPPEADFVSIAELDSQHPKILEMSRELNQGVVPPGFEQRVTQIAEKLAPVLASMDLLIVHNVFTKHFNLPLTAALFHLLDQGTIRHCVAWCHDLSWTSPHSRSKVFPDYPWDLLRTYRSDIAYVTISQERQREVVGLFGCSPEQIRVIYNGVDPGELLALSDVGLALIDRLGLWESDLSLLMPVRVTQAKNMELALHVVAALKKRSIRPKLVVTGPPDPHDEMNMEYFRVLLKLREKLDVAQEMRFVYESGPYPAEPFTIEMPVVAELLRVSDALFMPSQREGFGMPILEAGLAGIPVFSSDTVPATDEIGAQDVIRFSPQAEPGQVADLIFKWAEAGSVLRLRRRVRQNFTWQSIFQRKILPLLERGAP
ncbi:MAG TPA: glycosyltransferase family 4 protein [Anaerolineales bacterium]|nr:glycosyltransferase family 4 protein [Anaerolineales bacterium]